MRLQPLRDGFAVARQTPLHHTAPPTVFRQGTTSVVPQTAQINAASAAGEQICSRQTDSFAPHSAPDRFSSGHDFSRAANSANKCGFSRWGTELQARHKA